MQQKLILNVNRVVTLVATLVRDELKSSVSGSILHYFWWPLEPLLMMFVYAFVVKIVYQSPTPHFLSFLFVGLLPWRAFSNSLSHSVVIFRQSRELLLKVRFPIAALPLTIALTQFTYMLAAMPCVALLLYYDGVAVTRAIVWLPLILVAQLLLTASATVALAYIGALFKDMVAILRFALQILFFATPIIYAAERVPSEFQFVLKLNPLATLFCCYRAALMGQSWPLISELVCFFGFLGLLMIVALIIQWRFDKKIRKYI